MLFELAVAVLCVLLYVKYIHVQLPHDVIDRHACQGMCMFIKVFEEIPNSILARLGARGRHQVAYTYSFFNIIRALKAFHVKDKHGVSIDDTRIAGVRVRLYRAPGQRDSGSPVGSIVYLHGGGFCVMRPDDFDRPLTRLCARTQRTVYAVDYRKAPRHPFPAGLDDCTAVASCLLSDELQQLSVSTGVTLAVPEAERSRLVVMGDSAGGNLAAATANRLAKRSALEHKVQAQVLMYPTLQVVDFRGPAHHYYGQSFQATGTLSTERVALFCLFSYAGVDATKEELQSCTRNEHVSLCTRQHPVIEHLHYDHLPEHFRHVGHPPHHERFPDQFNEALFDKLRPFLTNPEFSPMFEPDLSQAPTSLVITCGYDVLRDDGYWYVRRLREAGVDAHWHNYEAALHGTFSFPHVSTAEHMSDHVTQWLAQLG